MTFELTDLQYRHLVFVLGFAYGVGRERKDILIEGEVLSLMRVFMGEGNGDDNNPDSKTGL